jgi:hypothetical protein
MLTELQTKDLFNLNLEDRKDVVDQGVDLLLMQVKLLSNRTEQTFSKVLNDVMFSIEKNKEEALNTENYELVWYYEELTWGVRNKIDELKKNK